LGRWNDERAQALAALPKPDLIWMHAVSVGEVGVARKLIAELLKQQPQRHSPYLSYWHRLLTTL
jgi:3-deoxy-D-manno-octulosonic-acid transferase